MGFLSCAEHLAFSGIVFFVLGRILPKKFRFEKFPFAPFEFENGGKIYKKIGISKWQKKVPDMSRIFRKIMPAKKIEKRPEAEEILVMIQETCMAEFVHFMLIISGTVCLGLWPGIGGRVCFYLNTFGNMVFIVIQRYNRPRLVSVLKRKKTAKKKLGEKEGKAECAF